MFASRSKGAAGNMQVVMPVHVYLAARATLLEITEQLETVGSPPPALLAQAHAVRIVEPRTGTSILAINVHQSRRRSLQSRPLSSTWRDELCVDGRTVRMQ